jgi:hypothetical protein
LVGWVELQNIHLKTIAFIIVKPNNIIDQMLMILGENNLRFAFWVSLLFYVSSISSNPLGSNQSTKNSW